MIDKRVILPAGKNIDPNKKAIDRIYENLPEDLKKKMAQNGIMSEKEHKRVLEQIKQESYEGKHRKDKPKFIIVLGQTGSGKTSVTVDIISNDNNLVVIDSDKYKAYRPDNEELLLNYLKDYAYLTAPDSYLHRDEMIVDSMNSKYDILLECAPSNRDGIFVDIDEIIKSGYYVEIHALGVSSLNSAISVHERYENALKANSPTAKLTSLERHDDSFGAVNDAVEELQKNSKVRFCIYKRGENGSFIPEKVYDSLNGKNTYSCPYEALLKTQAKDLDKMDKELLYKRINDIKNSMLARDGLDIQGSQFMKLCDRVKESIAKRNKKIER